MNLQKFKKTDKARVSFNQFIVFNAKTGEQLMVVTNKKNQANNFEEHWEKSIKLLGVLAMNEIKKEDELEEVKDDYDGEVDSQKEEEEEAEQDDGPVATEQDQDDEEYSGGEEELPGLDLIFFFVAEAQFVEGSVKMTNMTGREDKLIWYRVKIPLSRFIEIKGQKDEIIKLIYEEANTKLKSVS